MVSFKTALALLWAYEFLPGILGQSLEAIPIKTDFTGPAPVIPTAPEVPSTPDSGTLENDGEVYYDAVQSPPTPTTRTVTYTTTTREPATPVVAEYPSASLPPPIPPRNRQMMGQVGAGAKPLSNTFKSFGYPSPPEEPKSPESTDKTPIGAPIYTVTPSAPELEYEEPIYEQLQAPYTPPSSANRFKRFKNMASNKMYMMKRSVKGAAHKTAKEVDKFGGKFAESAREGFGTASKAVNGAAHKTAKEADKFGGKIAVTAKISMDSASKAVNGAAHKTKKETVKFGKLVGEKTKDFRDGAKFKLDGAAHKTAKEAVKLGKNLRKTAKHTKGSLTKFFRNKKGDLITEDESTSL